MAHVTRKILSYAKQATKKATKDEEMKNADMYVPTHVLSAQANLRCDATVIS